MPLSRDDLEAISNAVGGKLVEEFGPILQKLGAATMAAPKTMAMDLVYAIKTRLAEAVTSATPDAPALITALTRALEVATAVDGKKPLMSSAVTVEATPNTRSILAASGAGFGAWLLGLPLGWAFVIGVAIYLGVTTLTKADDWRASFRLP